MKNPPAFQFYPQDFLSDFNVQIMDPEMRGVYITLLSLCWIEDGLPSDSTDVQRLFNGCSTTVQRWDEIWSIVGRCFTLKSGKLRNPRLDREREHQIFRAKQASEAGKKSAEKRNNIERPFNEQATKDQRPFNTSSSASSSTSKDKIKDIKAEPENGSGPHVTDSPDPILTEFEAGFWSAYPVKLRKQDALKAYRSLRKTVGEMEIESAFMGYLSHLKAEKVYRNFDKQPMHPATFLRSDRWREYVGIEYRPKL